MVSVVSRGIPHGLQKYTVSCGKCCSVLEFQKIEAQVKVDRNETVYVLNCPICRNDIWIAHQALRPVIKSTDFRDLPYEPK